ncbi:ComF family protein, partial [Vibrio metoecus]
MPQPCTNTKSCPSPLTCQYNAMVTFSPSISIFITAANRQDEMSYPDSWLAMLTHWLRKTTAPLLTPECHLCRLTLDKNSPFGV